jgi:hypothetical protein
MNDDSCKVITVEVNSQLVGPPPCPSSNHMLEVEFCASENFSFERAIHPEPAPCQWDRRDYA